MTIGIYLMYWEQDDSNVYVGQSINIKYREKQHLDLLKTNAHYNYKIAEAYIKYGNPVFYTLEECLDCNLDDLEVLWIEEFNSINEGYNISSGGVAGRGLNHSQSKYSKRRLLRIFSLLYRTTMPYTRVSYYANVNVYLVHNIASGIHHMWLQSEYPEKFNQMLRNKSIRNKNNVKSLGYLNIQHKPLISPMGEVITNITNIAEFCRTHPLLKDGCSSTRSSIGKVLKGIKDSHKGWHLAKENLHLF